MKGRLFALGISTCMLLLAACDFTDEAQHTPMTAQAGTQACQVNVDTSGTHPVVGWTYPDSKTLDVQREYFRQVGRFGTDESVGVHNNYWTDQQVFVHHNPQGNNDLIYYWVDGCSGSVTIHGETTFEF